MLANDHAISLRWFGCSCYELVYRGKVYLLDAWFDRGPRTRAVGVTQREVVRAEAIFVGHAHFDHIADAPAIAARTGATIVGAPVPGSWWGHPLGQKIYHVSQQLSAHRDVLETKLVSGKVTFVHRILWPALLGVATAREPWQLQRLSGGTLERVRNRVGRIEGRELKRESSRGQLNLVAAR